LFSSFLHVTGTEQSSVLKNLIISVASDASFNIKTITQTETGITKADDIFKQDIELLLFF